MVPHAGLDSVVLAIGHLDHNRAKKPEAPKLLGAEFWAAAREHGLQIEILMG